MKSGELAACSGSSGPDEADLKKHKSPRCKEGSLLKLPH